MFRPAKVNLKALSNVSRRFSSTGPTGTPGATKSPTPPSSGNNSNLYLTIGAVAACGVTYMAYQMEVDPVYANKMKDVPGISLLNPIREGLVASGVAKKPDVK